MILVVFFIYKVHIYKLCGQSRDIFSHAVPPLHGDSLLLDVSKIAQYEKKCQPFDMKKQDVAQINIAEASLASGGGAVHVSMEDY